MNREEAKKRRREELNVAYGEVNYALGFLANFNVALIKDGLKRIVRSQAK